MSSYMASLQVAMGCLEDPHPFDIVNHAINNMDPAVKKQLMTSGYTGHRKLLALDPFTQLRYVTAYFHILGPNFERPDLSQIRELGHV